jgi:hypothetical protein
VTEAPDDRNLLRGFLLDLRDFVGLLANLLRDEKAQEMFGFSVDPGLVTHVDAVEATIAEIGAGGDVDLVRLAELGERLAAVTEAVTLIKQATETGGAGVFADELLGGVIDVVSLSYLAANYPRWLYIARLAGLLLDETPAAVGATGAVDAAGLGFWRVIDWNNIAGLVRQTWKLLGGDLETEDDARRLSVLLGAVGLWRALSHPPVENMRDPHRDPRSTQVLFGWDPDPAGPVTSVGQVRAADGRVLLASGSGDLTVRVWDPVAGLSLIQNLR